MVSENKALVHPSSVDSIPSSANQEDHVSMGTIGARKAGQICVNVRYVLACELLGAAQGLEFRKPLTPATAGRGVKAAYDAVRAAVKPLKNDRELYPDIEAIAGIIGAGELVRAVEKAAGRLR
ncbi:MAG: aromatic amino acid lyase [Candidatus Edwardsbacteria bacterium]|nr:aromatic amino acid lyase [Candidatus Edwardsbacteria bacterium]